MKHIAGYHYEALLERIIKELRSNQVDISNLRVSEFQQKHGQTYSNSSNGAGDSKNVRDTRRMKSRQKISALPSLPKTIQAVPSVTFDGDEQDTPLQPHHGPQNSSQVELTKHIRDASIMSTVSTATTVSIPHGKRTGTTNSSQPSSAMSSARSLYSSRNNTGVSPFGVKPQ